MDVRRSHQLFEIGVLGPVVLRADGIELALGAPKVRGVLALLAVRAPSVVSVDELILATWGNDPPRSASKAIQTYVSTLRRLLPVGAIKTQRDGYKLDAQPDAVDSIAFQEMLVTAHRLSPREPRQAARVLSDALGLWRGDALIDLVNHHVGQVEAARLHEMRRTAEEDRSESLLRSGDHVRLIADLTAAVGNEPYRERRWGQLMIALYRSGRQAEAIETYQRLRVMLDEELGLEPSAELSALEEAILLQKPELDWRSTESMDEISFASSDDYANPPEVLESPSGTSSTASILKDPVPSLAIEASSLDEPGHLPSGVVTFCFTDIEASTPMLARLGSQAYQQVVELQRQLIREAARPYGVEVRTEGDAMFFAFSSAREGVLASCEAQRALVRHSWPPGGDIRVRMGLHTGQASVTSDRDYVGLAVHQAARVMTAAHGGQVLVSSDVLTDVPDLERVEFRDLGEFSLRGLEGPTRLYQLCHPDLPTSFPPPRAPSAGVHNLGAVRTSFVGREDELATLAQIRELAILNHDPGLAAPADGVAFETSGPTPPSGTLTFLMSDIEGSTRLWEEQPAAMSDALRRHNDLMRSAIEGSEGHVFKTVGDAFCAAFPTAADATRAAEAAQRVFVAEPWPEGATLRVRMALHTGECEERDGDYFGPAVNRVARLTGIAHGGQVVLSRATAEVVRDGLPSGLSLRDMGSHILKDLSRTENVFQLEIEGLPTEFPPLRSLNNPELLNNLPEFVSSFVGRDAEMVELVKLVSDNRLVTLTGAGGTGKTRLAVQVAAELLDGTGDGVWLVELARVTDSEAVPSAVASALGVAERPGRAILDTLVDVLGGQRRLVVLDNCEHLLDACATLVDSIVRHCSGIQVLATSREPLCIDGEIVYRVPPLSLPPEGALEQADVVISGAAMLFVDRARSQLQGFVLEGDDWSIVASICRRLDGIPLAIELATTRLRSLSLSELDDRLEHRFELLTGGSRTALPRQQTLRALVDWSHDLLSEPERVLLRRLSVFLGGFDLEAVEAVCALGDLPKTDIFDLLASLVDKSMVIADGSGDTARHGMLETLRQYASERLHAVGWSETEQLLEAHSAHYVAYAYRAVPHLVGPSQGVWFARLDSEYANLRIAVEHLLHLGKPIEVLRLFGMTRYFKWAEYGVWVVKVIDEALYQAGDDLSPSTRAAALLCKAHAAFDDSVLARCASEALDAARAAEELALEAEALGLVCLTASFRGEPAEGLEPGRDAVAIARRLKDPALLGETLMHFGLAVQNTGDFPGAQAIFQEGLSVANRAGDGFLAQIMLCNYGNSLLKEGKLIEARHQWEMALELNFGRKTSATIVANLGYISLLEGDRPDAQSKFLRALQEHCLHGGTRDCAYDILGFALCASLTGDAERAAKLHGGADAFLDACGAEWESGFEKRLRDRDIVALRAHLGDQFEILYDIGRAQRTAEIVELALGRLTK
jgi:predicted ATPase/class 3 adenylate cyclase/DNA-binding SARP family transcriptional activator